MYFEFRRKIAHFLDKKTKIEETFRPTHIFVNKIMDFNKFAKEQLDIDNLSMPDLDSSSYINLDLNELKQTWNANLGTFSNVSNHKFNFSVCSKGL